MSMNYRDPLVEKRINKLFNELADLDPIAKWKGASELLLIRVRAIRFELSLLLPSVSPGWVYGRCEWLSVPDQHDIKHVSGPGDAHVLISFDGVHTL